MHLLRVFKSWERTVASKYKSTSHNLSSRGISILNFAVRIATPLHAYTLSRTHTHTLFKERDSSCGYKKRCLSSPARTGSILIALTPRTASSRHRSLLRDARSPSLPPALSSNCLILTICFLLFVFLSHTHTRRPSSSLPLFLLIATFARTMLPPCRKVTEQRLPPATVQAPLETAVIALSITSSSMLF